mgnify:CR=1 FL=1
MDDGTVARLDEQTFYVTTSSTGADGVYQWFTWWNAVWFMDVQFNRVQRAQVNVGFAEPVRGALRDYFERASTFLINRPGSPGIELIG